MKIIQIMPEFGLAGAETMCENLTSELVKMGHSVSVVSMYDYHSAITARMEDAGVNVIYLHKKPGLDPAMVWKMKRILKGIEPDVIHTHRYCAQYAIPAAILAGVKCRVHTIHSIAKQENGTFARKLNKFFFDHNGVVPVALSELIQETVMDEYHLPKNKIPVIFNGINLEKCLPKDSYYTGDSFRIIHIGRFMEVKNHRGLVSAFLQFHAKYTDSELWLIGDGETRGEIERFVSENEMQGSVKFLGLQSNVYPLLHDADIFTLPSNYEGIPMTLIEAMGTGLPIVATAVGGVPDMLSDGENALLVENNVQAIADAFERYYLDEALREVHGRKALLRSKAFSSETMAEKYIKIYEKKM